MLFAALLAASLVFLWYVDALGWPARIAAGAAIVAALWAVGRLCEGAPLVVVATPVEAPRPSTP
jgi:hypothetical protein